MRELLQNIILLKQTGQRIEQKKFPEEPEGIYVEQDDDQEDRVQDNNFGISKAITVIKDKMLVPDKNDKEDDAVAKRDQSPGESFYLL